MAPHIRFCTSKDGARIAFAVEGSGPPIVWVQHWVHHLEFDSDSQIWSPWLDVLTRQHTLVRFDWRGCGLSDRAPKTFSFESYLADLNAVIQAAGFDRFALFGMAGAACGMAMAYAADNPDKVSRLALLAPYIKGRLAGSPSPVVVQESQARLKVIELGWSNDTPAYEQFFTRLQIPDASPAEVKALGELLRNMATPQAGTALLESYWHTDVSEIAPRVQAPTIVFHARGDSVIPYRQGREVAACIPGASLVTIESRNHLLLSTEPAWKPFTERLLAFLHEPSGQTMAAVLRDLTRREREILASLARGLDNAEIAGELRISDKTVRNHVSIVLSKLGAKSRARAVAMARDAGFGQEKHR